MPGDGTVVTFAEERAVGVAAVGRSLGWRTHSDPDVVVRGRTP